MLSNFWKVSQSPLIQYCRKKYRRVKAFTAGEMSWSFWSFFCDLEYYGKLSAKYIGVDPKGRTVADVHADFIGGQLKKAFADKQLRKGLITNYNQCCELFYHNGIDILQACIPVSSRQNLRRLLVQGRFKFITVLNDHEVWRKELYG